MKLLLFSIALAMAGTQCQDDREEDYGHLRTEDEIGYVAEDMIKGCHC